MDLLSPVNRLHQHRSWVNVKLIDATSRLSDEQRHRRFEIGQGSVWQTLLHLVGAEYVWLETILGNDDPVMPGDLPHELVGNQRGDDAIQTMDELETFWANLDIRWWAFVDALEPEDLQRPIVKRSTSSHAGQRRATSLMDVLLHVCTHAHYTTAQLINMLRRLGVAELPDPMLITLARDDTRMETS
ncbi:MAG: DinB family protein [Planctomycetota bacterium]